MAVATVSGQPRFLGDEEATIAAGRALAADLSGELIFLHGDLGAGKTTLVRGILRSFGHAGAVKSPTYTIVEPYELSDRVVYHFDLYRINDPEELNYSGLDELLDSNALRIVEWPQKGAGALPEPDIEVYLNFAETARTIEIVDHR